MTEMRWFDPVIKYAEQLWQSILQFLPNILAAIVLVVVGWLLARLVRAIASRLIPRFYRLIPSKSFQRGLKTSGMERLTSEVVSGVAFWLVLLFFLAAATESLGLPVVSTLLSGLARYLPSVLAAVLIAVAGVVIGNLTRTAITTAAASAGLAYGELLGRLTQIAILLVVGVVAIDQVGIDSTFLMISMAIVLSATLGGMALGFGLGARSVVGNLLASHYLLQTYKVGQRIRIGETEGRILEISNTAVILETSQGRALVPAEQFSRATSVLLAEG